MTKRKPGFLLLSTNKSCFMCYKDVPVCPTVSLSSSSLKYIYRLLKVNLVETISLHKVLERQDVHVSLCQGCRALNEAFSQLYREMEAIRMKLDDSLEAISEMMVMGPGERSAESTEGTRLERDDKPVKSHSERVEKLRKEIMLKYRSYKKKSQPRIRIPKMTIKTTKVGALTNSEAEAAAAPTPTLATLIKQEPPSLADDDNDPASNEVVSTPDISAVKTESTENGDLLQDGGQPLKRSKSNQCKSTGGLRRKEWEAVFIEGGQTDELPHPCRLCWNSFPTQFELANHVTKAHNTSPRIRRFTCPLCQKSFFTKVQLTRHQTGVQKCQRQFTCQFCSKLFSTEDILIKHETSVCKSNPNVRTRQEEGASSNSTLASGSSHEDMDVVSLTPVASSSSRRKQTFHTRSHFTCALCGGFFTYEADLAKHQTQDCEAVVGASQPVSMEPKSAQAASANSKGCITSPRKPVKLGNTSNPKPKPKAQKGPRMYSKVTLPPRSPPQIPTFRYQHVCQHCQRIFSTEDFLFKHQRLSCKILGRSSPSAGYIDVDGNAHGTLDAAAAIITKSEHVELDVDSFNYHENNQSQLGDGEEMEESILPD